MINVKVKIDDKDIFKEYMKQNASLFVGYTQNKKYDAIDEPFYANVAKPNTKGDWGEKVGKPRLFGKRPAITAVEVALANEFGGKNRPPRPFVRYCIRKNMRKWLRYFDKTWLQYPDIAQTMWKLGNKIRGDLSATVWAWSTPPNSPRTIKKKGFNNPLVDSGNMAGDFIEIEVNGKGADI